MLCCLHAELPGYSQTRVYGGRYMQATREQKSRLEKAVISAGRQLKLVTAQRDNLIQMMRKKVADETAKNLEAVYAPLLETYKAKCTRLEQQILSAQPAQPSLAAQQSFPQLPDSLGDFGYWTERAAPAPALFA